MLAITKEHWLGMELTRIDHKSCRAYFAEGKDWVTLYEITSREQGKGHATELLKSAKEFYEAQGKTFGGSVALNEKMRRIYQKLMIKEYD